MPVGNVLIQPSALVRSSYLCRFLGSEVFLKLENFQKTGSVKMGRLLRIEVDLLDVPGSLWRLMGIIAQEKANILHIFHDRLNLASPLQVSRVKLNLETRGHDHARELVAKLKEAGYDAKQTV